MPDPDRKGRFTAFVVAIAVLVATPLAVVATDAFTDVPESNVHHDNITWLRDAGVTAGCNPPANDEYCPDDAVTRAQMATFMRRLSENQVVDADRVDGQDSIAPAITYGGASVDGQVNTSSTTFVDVDEVSITTDVPTRLVADVTAETYCHNPAPAGSDWCAGQVLLDGEEMEPTAHITKGFAIDHASPDEEYGVRSFTKVSSGVVEPGEHTITFQVAVNTADTSLRVDDWTMVVHAYSETQ